MSNDIYDLFETLFQSNKYLIKITNTINNNWQIFLYKNKHIQLDIQTENSLNSQYIDLHKLLEIIDNEDSMKISYTCYYDDFKNYNKMMAYIMNEIQSYYFHKNKKVVIKYKTYY